MGSPRIRFALLVSVDTAFNAFWSVYLFQDVKYDAEREENAKLEKKRKQLDNIEEARRRDEELKKKG